MAVSESDLGKRVEERNDFATTHWSVVLAAGNNESSAANYALEKLCQTYWYPLYAYVRRAGHSPHDAQDLTQAFFLCLIKRQSIGNADPQKGRFRSFLLGAMNYFLANEWAKLHTQKRGGNQQMICLDIAAAEERLGLEADHHESADRLFDKTWANTLLEKVLMRLENEFRDAEKLQQFEMLKQTLGGPETSQPYAELSEKLQMKEGALKTAVHRLRKRYRQLLEAEIAHTVSSPEEVKQEIAYLFAVTTRE